MKRRRRYMERGDPMLDRLSKRAREKIDCLLFLADWLDRRAGDREAISLPADSERQEASVCRWAALNLTRHLPAHEEAVP